MSKEITSKNWYEAENYDSEKEYNRVCATCGHISEMHEHSEYDGESCIMGCDCTEFICKIVDNKIVYDE